MLGHWLGHGQAATDPQLSCHLPGTGRARAGHGPGTWYREAVTDRVK